MWDVQIEMEEEIYFIYLPILLILHGIKALGS